MSRPSGWALFVASGAGRALLVASGAGRALLVASEAGRALLVASGAGRAPSTWLILASSRLAFGAGSTTPVVQGSKE